MNENKAKIILFISAFLPILIAILTGNLEILIISPIALLGSLVMILIYIHFFDLEEVEAPVYHRIHHRSRMEAVDMIPSPGFKGTKVITQEELTRIEDIKNSITNCFVELSDMGLFSFSKVEDLYTISIKYYRHSEYSTFEEFKLATLYPEQMINEMILESISKFQIEYPSVTISAAFTLASNSKKIIQFQL